MRVLILLLLLTGSALAEKVRVQFKTSVDGKFNAQIFLRVDPNKPPEPLGTTREPIELDLDKLQGQPSYTLIFRSEGHLEEWVTLYDPVLSQGMLQARARDQWESLRQGVWPPPKEGPYVDLKPNYETTVVFWTYPPGAEVVLSNVSSPSAQGKPIGISCQPIRFTRSDFWHPESKSEKDPVVEFRNVKYYHNSAPMTATGIITIPKQGGRFPGVDSYQLAPTHWWAPVYWYARLHPVQLAIGIPLLLAALGGATVFELRRRKVMRFLRAREARLADLEKMALNREDKWIGTLLGNWRVMSKLGAGGMAVVYKAISDDDLLLGDEAPAVALKLMNLDLSENDEFRKRFQREIQVSRKLSDPAIVRVVDFGDKDGHLYLAMELVEGVPLRDYVRPNFPIGEALRYFEQMLRGLAHAHKEGVVHRDIKPDNIMVTRDGRIKIMDFGLARDQAVNTQITQSGSVLGTPAYVSPEQITGGGMNKSSDQYSLGITFYEILTGRRPFANEDSVALLFSHLSEKVVSMREWRPEIPDSIDKVVLRMLAKDPSERYPNLEECLEALQKAAQDRGESAPESAAAPQEKPRSYNTNVAS